jgi:hypothetical protein
MEPLIQKGFDSLINWWPVIFISVLMFCGLYRFIKGVGIKIVEALEKPSGALSQQAMSVDRLTQAIHNYIERDLSEHREIIILQKVIIEKISALGRQNTIGAGN